MKNNLSILATLALAATLLPAAFASRVNQHSPKTIKRNHSLVRTNRKARPRQVRPQIPKPRTFSGMVVKAGEHYVLKTDKMTYQLDDEMKAKQFEGKQVTVNGTLDKSTGVIRVTDIQPAS